MGSYTHHKSKRLVLPPHRAAETKDMGKEYCGTRAIIAETEDMYLIDWKPQENEGDFMPTWEPKENANEELVLDWEWEKGKEAAKEDGHG